MNDNDFFLEILRVCKNVGEKTNEKEFNNFVFILERNFEKIDKKELAVQIEVLIGYLVNLYKVKLEESGVSGVLNKENKGFIKFLKSH